MFGSSSAPARVPLAAADCAAAVRISRGSTCFGSMFNIRLLTNGQAVQGLADTTRASGGGQRTRRGREPLLALRDVRFVSSDPGKKLNSSSSSSPSFVNSMPLAAERCVMKYSSPARNRLPLIVPAPRQTHSANGVDSVYFIDLVTRMRLPPNLRQTSSGKIH